MIEDRDRALLSDMLKAARKAIRLAEGRSRSDLDDEDSPLPDALIRLVSVVGEAANHISESARTHFSAIPWRDVVDMRNLLIHEYFAVNLDILWATVEDDLPGLVIHLEAELEDGEGS